MPVEMTPKLLTAPIDDSSKKLTGRHVLLMLVGFFGVMTVANAFLVYYALNSWTGLDVESSYEAGQVYQSTLDQAEAQKLLGWQLDSGVVRSDDGKLVITAEIRGTDGAVVRGLSAEGLLARPTQTALDHKLEFHRTNDGTLVAVIDTVEPGAWDLRLVVSDDEGRSFRSENRVVLKAAE